MCARRPRSRATRQVVYAKRDKKGKIDITFGKLTFFLDRHALKEAASAPAGDGAESGGDKKQEKPAKKAKKEKKMAAAAEEEEEPRGATADASPEIQVFCMHHSDHQPFR